MAPGTKSIPVDFERLLDRYAGGAICHLLSLFACFRKSDRKTENVKHILVILLSEMGSLVLAYPMFRQLKRQYPEATLHALVFEKNREVLDVLGVMPAGNIMTIRDIGVSVFVKDTVKALRRVRRIGVDVVIDCELFARFSSILSFLSGASVRVGFHAHTQEGLYRGSFINRPVLYNPYNHLSVQFLTLAAAIESDCVPVSKLLADSAGLKPPLVQFYGTQIDSLREKVYTDFPAIEGKKLVLIYPGGGLLPVRAWPLDYYCWVSQKLVAAGYAVAVIGLAQDRQLARAIRKQADNPACIDLTGYTTSIRELMQLFHLAALLITNDGGPGQFAAMTPLATIILYGPETPVLYGPLGTNSHVFFKPLACTPCLTAYNHRRSPCDGDNLCLKRISPRQVLDQALEILGHS